MSVGAPQLLTESRPSSATPELRWRRRRTLQAAIRLSAVVAPAVAATAVAIAYGRTVPAPQDAVGTVIWWAVFAGAVVATWTVTAELLQRTLPLATLLDLTLTFPESVPSRFSILRRNIDRRHLETDLRQLRERSDPESAPRAQLILELAVAMSIHDSRTRAHSERVRTYTDLVAQQLRLSQADADRLRWAALLHDIGKLAVAPEILNKPELPDDDELESLRNHPLEGYKMIAPLHRWLGPWAAAVRDHHERFDGTGYPSGLRGRAISLGGRIVAVTDSYETMTAGRPYRTALSVREAREELVRRSGHHFDPEVVRAFLAISMGRLWPVIGIGAVLAEVPFLPPVTWRLSQIGSRAASGFATASVTAVLIVAGVAGPVAAPFVYGPSVKPQVAGVSTNPNAAQMSVQATSPSVAPPVAALPATSPAAVTGSAPGSAPAPTSGANVAPTGTPAPPGTGGGGGGKALYPAGIAKHATLPPGIAKQANPFAQWRAHH